MFAPSKATPTGLGPLGNSVGTVLALYHFNNATFSGFESGGAPFPASWAVAPVACCAWLTNKFAIARTATIRDTPITIRVFMTFYSCGRSRDKRLEMWRNVNRVLPEVLACAVHATGTNQWRVLLCGGYIYGLCG